jgi:AcrR family transcriptional regulator
MADSARSDRRNAVVETKRKIILEAARRVIAAEGLREVNMRAIAKEAGYTPGTIYGYFPSKEHIYAAAHHESLTRLRDATETAAAAAADARDRFIAAGIAFFDFYDTNPPDLELGLYLIGGGIQPRLFSDELNQQLNAALLATLDPVRRAAEELGADSARANILTADTFAHAAGLMLLTPGRRLELFHLNARQLMHEHLEQLSDRATK